MKIKIMAETFEKAAKDQAMKMNLDNALATLRKIGTFNKKEKAWETEDKKIIGILDKLGIGFNVEKDSKKKRVTTTSQEFYEDVMGEFSELKDGLELLRQSVQQEGVGEPEIQWMEGTALPEWSKSVRWNCTHCGHTWVGGVTFQCPSCHFSPEDDAPTERGMEYHSTQVIWKTKPYSREWQERYDELKKKGFMGDIIG